MNTDNQENHIFLEVLNLYLNELKPDPCFEQTRQSYAKFSDQRAFHLDNQGSPVHQLLHDAKAEKAGFLKETAEAIQQGGV